MKKLGLDNSKYVPESEYDETSEQLKQVKSQDYSGHKYVGSLNSFRGQDGMNIIDVDPNDGYANWDIQTAPVGNQSYSILGQFKLKNKTFLICEVVPSSGGFICVPLDKLDKTKIKEN